MHTYTHTYIHRYVHTGAWIHTRTYTLNTNLYTHARLAVILLPRERGRKMTIYLLWALGLRQHSLPVPEKKRERVKERNRGGSRKAKGRRTTEEDRGWSSERPRMSQKELQVKREGESLLWSRVLWFGPVQSLVVLESGCGLCGLGWNEQGNKPGQERIE